MSSRPLIPPHLVITDGDMASNITSTVTVISNISMMSYSYTWAGATPIGLVVVEVSDDYSQNADGTVKNAGTWNELPLSTTLTVAGNTGTGFVDIDQLGAQAIRTRYMATSGTGTMQVIYKGKVA